LGVLYGVLPGNGNGKEKMRKSKTHF